MRLRLRLRLDAWGMMRAPLRLATYLVLRKECAPWQIELGWGKASWKRKQESLHWCLISRFFSSVKGKKIFFWTRRQMLMWMTVGCRRRYDERCCFGKWMASNSRKWSLLSCVQNQNICVLCVMKIHRVWASHMVWAFVFTVKQDLGSLMSDSFHAQLVKEESNAREDSIITSA